MLTDIVRRSQKIFKNIYFFELGSSSDPGQSLALEINDVML